MELYIIKKKKSCTRYEELRGQLSRWQLSLINHVRDLVKFGSEDYSLTGHKPHRPKLRVVGDPVSCAFS